MALSEEARYQLRRGELLLARREQRRRALRATAERAAEMLRAEFGAARVWLFGSLRRPWFHEESDLDLAVSGIASDRQDEARDRVEEIAQTKVDLVFWEQAEPPLRERILADGEVLAKA